MTGRYPFRTDTGVWPDEPVINEGRMTIASLLKSEGNYTAMVGKWHPGFDESHTTDQSGEQPGANTRAAYRTCDPAQPLAGGPVDLGFDNFFGIRAPTDIPPYFYIRGDQVVIPPVDTIDDNYSGGYWTDIQGAFWRAGGIPPDFELIDVLPRFTSETVQVIHEHKASAPEPTVILNVGNKWYR